MLGKSLVLWGDNSASRETAPHDREDALPIPGMATETSSSIQKWLFAVVIHRLG